MNYLKITKKWDYPKYEKIIEVINMDKIIHISLDSTKNIYFASEEKVKFFISLEDISDVYIGPQYISETENKDKEFGEIILENIVRVIKEGKYCLPEIKIYYK